MHVIIVVMEKANHTLHFKDKSSGTKAYNELRDARAAHAERFAVAHDGNRTFDVYDMEDDFGTRASLRLTCVNSVQMADPEVEMDMDRKRKIMQMHSDLSYGAMVAEDPTLKDAQAKQQARERLVGMQR